VAGQQDQDQTQNFVEQSVASGGFASNREVQTFGQLARQLNIDPLVLVNFLLDHRVQLDGAVHGPGSYFAGPNATLEDLVEAAGGTVGWADESGVELISTMVDQQSGRSVTSRKLLPLRKGMLARYVVQPNDHFRFSQVLTDVGIGSVTIQGEVRDPGAYSILRGEHLSDLLKRAGGLTSTAYPLGTVFLRKSAAQLEQDGYARAADEVEDQLMVAMTRVGNSKLTPDVFTSMQTFVKDLRTRQALGRISIVADPKKLAADPAADPLLQAGDVVYVPPRPSTVAVLGQVSQPGNFTYRANATIEDYVERAGGYKPTADEDHTYIVLPNGEARRVTRSWLSFNDVAKLPAGSAIVVPRDITPLDLRQTIIDVSQVFSQFAVSIASVAVLSTR
jgi:protein involved in polysaccharide export with SLBB domain